MENQTPQQNSDTQNLAPGAGDPGHRPSVSKKRWKDLSSKRRARIVAQAAVQLTLTAVVLWDLRHRPADKVKGSKRLWAFAALVQPFGPIAYLVFGRKKFNVTISA